MMILKNNKILFSLRLSLSILFMLSCILSMGQSTTASDEKGLKEEVKTLYFFEISNPIRKDVKFLRLYSDSTYIYEEIGGKVNFGCGKWNFKSDSIIVLNTEEGVFKEKIINDTNLLTNGQYQEYVIFNNYHIRLDKDAISFTNEGSVKYEDFFFEEYILRPYLLKSDTIINLEYGVVAKVKKNDLVSEIIVCYKKNQVCYVMHSCDLLAGEHVSPNQILGVGIEKCIPEIIGRYRVRDLATRLK